MRLVILATTLALMLAVQPAFAQGKPDSPPAAVNLAPQHVEAGRLTLNVMMIENGLLNELVLEAFRTHLPEYQRTISSAPFYATLTPARRQAVDAYVANLGPVLSEEVMRLSPTLLDAYAPRMAAIFNEAELSDIRDYMRSPAGASLFRRAAISGARGETAPITYTAEEMAGEAQFLLTAGGRAWAERATEFNAFLHELGYQSVAQTGPTFRARAVSDICALVGEQCPPEMRSAQRT